MITVIKNSLILALLDAVSLPMVKKSYTTGNHLYFIIACLVSIAQLSIFYMSMKYTNMTLLNLSWDILSDITVTLYGLFILKESISNYQRLGIILSFVSIYLLNHDNLHK